MSYYYVANITLLLHLPVLAGTEARRRLSVTVWRRFWRQLFSDTTIYSRRERYCLVLAIRHVIVTGEMAEMVDGTFIGPRNCVLKTTTFRHWFDRLTERL